MARHLKKSVEFTTSQSVKVDAVKIEADIDVTSGSATLLCHLIELKKAKKPSGQPFKRQRLIKTKHLVMSGEDFTAYSASDAAMRDWALLQLGFIDPNPETEEIEAK